MKPSEILNEILNIKKLNAKSFSEAIGLDRPQAIYDILKGKTKSISQSMADKIVSVFSEFNKGWILTGEGEMLKSSTGGIYSEELRDKNIVHEPTASYNNSSSEIWLKSNIDKLIDDNSRNSRSIEKMVDTAERNSQTLAKLIDKLIDSGFDFNTNTKKGDSEDNEGGAHNKSYGSAAG